LPGPFNPLNVTNAVAPDYAGKANDYTEQFGGDPVALVFAREVSEPLTTLVKKLDRAVAKNKSARLRAVVVVLSDDDGMEQKLKALADEEGLKNVSLALVEPASARFPKHYKLSPAADVTVILYRAHKVVANHAFAKGGLTNKEIAAILADLPKIAGKR
jgi:hypothetical protein